MNTGGIGYLSSENLYQFPTKTQRAQSYFLDFLSGPGVLVGNCFQT